MARNVYCGSQTSLVTMTMLIPPPQRFQTGDSHHHLLTYGVGQRITPHVDTPSTATLTAETVGATAMVPLSNYTNGLELVRSFSAQNVESTKALSMKFFPLFVLQAWRHRRHEIQKLQQVVAQLQSESMQNTNQLHVVSSLLHVEQRRNDDIVLQLNRAQDVANKMRNKVNSLNQTVDSLRCDKKKAEQERDMNRQSYDSQILLTKQIKMDLITVLREQRKLKMDLSSTKSESNKSKTKVEELQEQLVDLQKEHNETCKSENQLLQELVERDETIKELKQMVQAMREQLVEVQHFCRPYKRQSQIHRSQENERQLSEEVAKLRDDIILLKHQLQQQQILEMTKQPIFPPIPCLDVHSCSPLRPILKQHLPPFFSMPRCAQETLYFFFFFLLPAFSAGKGQLMQKNWSHDQLSNDSRTTTTTTSMLTSGSESEKENENILQQQSEA